MATKNMLQSHGLRKPGACDLRLSVDGKTVCVPYDRQQELVRHTKGSETSWQILKILSEFIDGFEFLEQYTKAVSIFGSARTGFDDRIYKECTELSYELAKTDFAVFTGGGPGIMEAANKGAREAGGQSVGININLPGHAGMTERANAYITESESFNYFFTRKLMLSFASQIYIFFPGGFGTLDELFEMLTLVQTKKTTALPIILVGKSYWSPLDAWIREFLYEKNRAINKEDMDIYTIVDSAQEALEHIKKCLEKEL
jgi:uncharacterized protein (TIGR00730 family)